MSTGKAIAPKNVSGKRKTADSGDKRSLKRCNVAEDVNKPKGPPPNAFFVFMEEFRSTFPKNRSVSEAAVEGGIKWKAMTETEKAPYMAEAEKRKADYQKTMAAYVQNQEKTPYIATVELRKVDYQSNMAAWNKNQVKTLYIPNAETSTADYEDMSAYNKKQHEPPQGSKDAPEVIEVDEWFDISPEIDDDVISI